jgi:hypothetical protein
LAIALCRREPFALTGSVDPDAATTTLLLSLFNDGHLAFGRSRSKS